MPADEMNLEQLLDAALRLDTKQREVLAQRLLASLDDEAGEVDPEVEAAWAAEIERRLRAIDEGKVELVSWDSLEQEMGNILGDSAK